ncbi:MAG TPA: hypothetical protein VGD36_06060, partial [Xanthobacteraceae bacterium]
SAARHARSCGTAMEKDFLVAVPALVPQKLEASRALVDELIARGSPRATAFWERREENEQWSRCSSHASYCLTVSRD